MIKKLIPTPKRARAFAFAAIATFSSLSIGQQGGQQSSVKPSALFQTPGMAFFTPQEFYNGPMDSIIKDKMPEIEVLSAQKNKETKRLMNFLMGEGVSMGFGVNPNRDSYFDLYGTLSVDVEMDYPAPQFGETKESEGGRRYFPDHDAVHLWALRGVGPRLADLPHRKKIIHEWAKVLMDAEALATAYNSAFQVKEYWNWRFRQTGATAQEIATFEAANKGVMSIGHWNYESYMDVVLTNVRGDVRGQNRLLSENISYDKYKAAQAAQIPALFPPLSERIGDRGEKFFFQHVFAPLFSVTALYRPKSGYHALMKATIQLLEYYYSPFYVKWADRYQIGDDLKTAQKSLEQRINLFKKDNLFGDVVTPAEGRFEAQQIRNLITQHGRKLIEFEELAKKDPTIFNSQDMHDMEKFHEYLVDLNNRLLKAKESNRAFNTAELQNLKDSYEKVTESLSKRFPVDRYIPAKYRLGYASYEKFWADPYAIVIDRSIVLSKFLSAKGIWKESLKLRLQGITPKTAVPLDKKDVLLGQLENQLAQVYNQNRSSKKDFVLGSSEFDVRAQNFAEAIQIQFSNFTEQIKEYQHISWDERIQILEVAGNVQASLNEQLKELRAAQKNSDNALQVMALENSLRERSHAALKHMVKVLQVLDYSALRSGKSGIMEAFGSAMMNKVVEGLGQTLELSNIKALDMHFTILHKIPLKKLAEIANKDEKEKFVTRAKARIVEIVGKKQKTVCTLGGVCLDDKALNDITKFDLVNKTKTTNNAGRIDVLRPINKEVFDLMDLKEKMPERCEGILL